jgi:hypothetical protein
MYKLAKLHKLKIMVNEVFKGKISLFFAVILKIVAIVAQEL